MPKTLIHTMRERGSTYGAVTQRAMAFAPGDEIEAPEGEFRHLPPGAYETRPMTAAPAPEPEAKAPQTKTPEKPVAGEKVSPPKPKRKARAKKS